MQKKAPIRLIDVGAVLRAGRQPAVVAALAAVLAVYCLYHATRFSLSAIWPLAPKGDASIVFELSRQVFASADYPARLELDTRHSVFPYPPSAVIVFKALTLAGPTAFMVAWFGLMAAGLLIAMRASVAHERIELASNWILVGCVALAVASPPVAWDLQNANSNLIYLGIALAGFALTSHRPLIAGMLVALSASLKLYSGLLLLYLLLHAPRRAVQSSLVALLLLWALLPLVFFGSEGSVAIYAGWREQIRIVGDYWVHQYEGTGTGPPIVALWKAIVALTGHAPDATTTRLYVLLLQVIWSLVLGWYAWRAVRFPPAAIPSRAALADWIVLLLAPLPFSPWLEPYHAIPILPAAILCLVIALDDRVRKTDRFVAGAALVGLGALTLRGPPFQFRGLGLLAQFVLLTIALGTVRPRLSLLPASDGSPAPPRVKSAA